MSYPGGKNGAGVYQTIINLMPPHRVYIEPFLGGGAILRLKKPSAVTIGIDVDAGVLARFSDADRSGKNGDAAGLHRHKQRVGPAPNGRNGEASDRQFIHADALEWLSAYSFSGDELVYCDPPYMHETRNRKDLYRYEMTDSQHKQLLKIILKLPCMVMISGYWSKLYARDLASWNVTRYQAVTRSGRVATEWLWFNFPPPVALHDYRYLGKHFRERERIKRKTLRWQNRIKRMPELEKRALLHALDLVTSPIS
jgi:hypothetical protein